MTKDYLSAASIQFNILHFTIFKTFKHIYHVTESKLVLADLVVVGI